MTQKLHEPPKNKQKPEIQEKSISVYGSKENHSSTSIGDYDKKTNEQSENIVESSSIDVKMEHKV